MSTQSQPRPNPQGPQRPQGGAAPGAGAMVSLDPIKLLHKYKWVLLASLAVGGVLGVAAHFALLKLAPKYTSFVVFQCTPVDEEIGKTNPAIVNPEEMERFIGTQVATMKSEQIIAKVANDSRLEAEAPVWTRQFHKNGTLDIIEANKELQKIVKAYAIPNTYLIKLSLSVGNKEDAAGLVRLVRENYIEQITSKSSKNVIQRKDVIRNAITQAEQDIKELNTRRARLVRDGDVDSIYSAQSVRAQKLRGIDVGLLEIQQAIEFLEVQRITDEAKLERETGTDYDESLRNQVDQSPLILGFKQNKKLAEADLISMQAMGYGNDHRAVRRTISTIQALERKIEDTREELLRDAFEARVQGTRMMINQYRAQEADLLKQHEQLTTELTELTRISGEIKDIDQQIQATVLQQAEHQSSLAQLNASASLESSARVVVSSVETVPDRPSFPVIYMMIPAGVFVVGALTAGVILLFEFLDQRVKSAADIAMMPRTRPLGIIPDVAEDPANPSSPETVFRDHPTSVMAESYRQLRTKVGNEMLRNQDRSLLVVGAMPGSGATSVAINFAAACAARGQKTLIIDTNHRRPRVHSAMGLDSNIGLADVLSGEKALAECIQKSGERSPDVLAVGSLPHRIVERLGTDAMTNLLKQASELYEMVIVDTSPAIVSGDASTLANQTDASLLVVRAMVEKRGQVTRLRNELSDGRADFLGVLVNGVKASAGGYMRKNIRTSHSYHAGATEKPAT
ncbi:MAG: AAA family ATPase [Phycisphaerales bacterium]|nr:AAA family ATPase [Phycisphaerales bacterium]